MCVRGKIASEVNGDKLESQGSEEIAFFLVNKSQKPLAGDHDELGQYGKTTGNKKSKFGYNHCDVRIIYIC